MKTIKVTIIRVSGLQEDLELPAENIWKAIEDQIDAKILDKFMYRSKGKPEKIVWVDDLGLVQGRKALNPEATRMYREMCRPGTNAVIVGDVAVMDADDPAFEDELL